MLALLSGRRAGEAGSLSAGVHSGDLADGRGSALQQETWLLSFIDILTLLLTLFVLLVAYQQHDGTVLSPDAAGPQTQVATAEAVAAATVEPATAAATDTTTDMSTEPAAPAGMAFDLTLHPALQAHVEVSASSDAINLEINDSILFDIASAELTGDGRQLLAQLATLLAQYPQDISVEGHTDNLPIQSRLFPSNWDLSATRAVVVTRELASHGIDAARLRAIGYGDHHPRADNSTAEGRARNRRVSFILHASAMTADNQSTIDPSATQHTVTLPYGVDDITATRIARDTPGQPVSNALDAGPLGLEGLGMEKSGLYASALQDTASDHSGQY